MQTFRSYLLKHSEAVFALLILWPAPLISYLVPYKLVFLNVYFIIILLGAHYLETRTALMGGILSSILITLYVYYLPHLFLTGLSQLDLWMHLVCWTSFLILTAALVAPLLARLRAEVRRLEEEKKLLQKHLAAMTDNNARLADN